MSVMTVDDLDCWLVVLQVTTMAQVTMQTVALWRRQGKVRAVPILPQFRPVLIEAMEGKSLDERIFTGPFGGTLTSSNLIRAIGLREWRDEVKRFPRGEPPLHIHDLRHTALTLMFEAGVPANWVQAIAGHSSLDVTMLYTGANEKAAVKAGELFGGYLEKSIQLSLGENHGGEK